MSGFEVVGVVLAVLPLAMRVIEDVKTGKGIIASLLRWQSLTNDLIRELNMQNLFLGFTVRTIIPGAATDDNALGLVSETTAADDFRDYLGPDTYLAFLQSLEAYNKALRGAVAKLMEILGLKTVGPDIKRAKDHSKLTFVYIGARSRAS